jgi:hypothetical protein
MIFEKSTFSPPTTPPTNFVSYDTTYYHFFNKRWLLIITKTQLTDDANFIYGIPVFGNLGLKISRKKRLYPNISITYLKPKRGIFVELCRTYHDGVKV